MTTAPIRIAEQPFTDANPARWDGELGPAWITIDTSAPGGFTADTNLCEAVRSFIASALALTDPADGVIGTVYATRISIGCIAGDMHYDTGCYDPTRQTTRVVSAWTSNGVPAQNVFLTGFSNEGDPIGVFADRVPAELLTQPPNGHAVAFDEGTHLHGRAHLDYDPAEHGYFLSLALYREGQAVDLHCPRLAALRERGPADRADGYITARAVY